ncbi:hypothetical protein Pdca_34240 [Pseudonocardia autotrophica]|nr:hypothetical protein Pdca_34240 [Pseudonocardia autotrophica]
MQLVELPYGSVQVWDASGSPKKTTDAVSDEVCPSRIIGSSIRQFGQFCSGACAQSGRVRVQSPTQRIRPPSPAASGVVTSTRLLLPETICSGRFKRVLAASSRSSSVKVCTCLPRFWSIR